MTECAPAATVAALFVRADSIYKQMPGVDCYDADRDALKWPGGCPGVFHPPCRAWGRLAHFAKPREGEKELALWAVDQVRRWGGVLEHPECSRVWDAAHLPTGNDQDGFGGFTIAVDQHWWGHRANKPTWLYVCGIDRRAVPPIQMGLNQPTHAIKWDRRSANSKNRFLLRLPDAEREHTPPSFAKWLVELARKCRRETTHLTLTNPPKALCGATGSRFTAQMAEVSCPECLKAKL